MELKARSRLTAATSFVPLSYASANEDILWKLGRSLIAQQRMIPAHDSNRFQHHGRNPRAGARVVAMTDTVANLILDLVEWVGRKERTYHETMEAWQTS